MRAVSIRVRDVSSPFGIEHSLAAILDRLDHAVFVIDSSFAIHFVNDRARLLAHRTDAIAIEQQHLVFLAPLVRARLGEFVVRADDPENKRNCCRCSVPRSSGERDYLLAAYRLKSAHADVELFSIEIYEPLDGFVVDRDVLRELFGLTAMEANVIAGLFATRNVRELSRRLGISGNTVRTHIRAAYAKCEVHSLSQLFQLIALSPR